jgi:hypothetical protein
MRTALAIATGLLTGCQTGGSSVIVCPALVEYSAEEQRRAAEELRAMARPSLVADRMMPDYGRLRDQVRACRRE